MSIPSLDQLTAYALGEGTPAERAAIEAHLAADPAARAEVEAIRDAGRLLSAALEMPAGQGLDDRRRADLAGLSAPAARRPLRFPGWLAVATTGALAAGLAVAVLPSVLEPEAGPRQQSAGGHADMESDDRFRKEEAAGPAPSIADVKTRRPAEAKADGVPSDAAAGTAVSTAFAAKAMADEPEAARQRPVRSESRAKIASAPAAPAALAEPAPAAAPKVTADAGALVTANAVDRLAAEPVPTASTFLPPGTPEERKDAAPGATGEGYPAIATGGWHRVTTATDDANRLSTFGADVDTASYANVRRFLRSGQLPPVDAVRAEELINAFRYGYAPPRDRSTPFAVHPQVAVCPWDSGHRLVRIGIKGYELDAATRPPANLVFLVDTSGSMDEPTKLPLVQRALTLLTRQLRADDHVAIVTYAGNAGLVLDRTSGEDRQRILAAIDGMGAGGSTNGAGGIALAYETATRGFIRGGVNRVVLCTDGDFNVGVSSREELERLITDEAKTGVFLTALGFGMGNYQDTTLQVLADRGNGQYAYIDSEAEARRQLVDGCTGMLVTIAKDLKLQVEFNPATVAAWRLIGYEKRALAHRDFLDDRKDGGELGAGHTVTALYEIEPAGSLPALRYAAQKTADAIAGAKPAGDELLTVGLRWKLPDSATSSGIAVPVSDAAGDDRAGDADTRFAAAVAEFALALRNAPGAWDLDRVLRTAQETAGSDPQRLEFIDLVRTAQQLRK